jgi:hypothetical protein
VSTETGEPPAEGETLEGSDSRPPGEVPLAMISPRLVSAVVVVALVLLVVVVVVGVTRGDLDTTGVATVLSTLISGIVVGVLIRGRNGPPS